MGVKVKGVSAAQARLDAVVDNIVSRKALRAIHSALLLGGAQAAVYTPIDTSNLINSQYRDVFMSGTRITGRVGYSANYAVYVHDPDIRQNFTRTTAKKEFLTKGFDDMREQIAAVVKKELSL
ncbi:MULTISPECIES: hypothetical protein [Enterobacteriaceae]|uniref:hypothetical protein n=1 Tax=Enterobacteriaceae TaxID=543 RepID=UPI000272B06C|nr:hypothetical protein [Enterobacter sp. Ag1]EJF31701.1 hypothetical protein A936_08913 [Enterobacter sp. Ag1]